MIAVAEPENVQTESSANGDSNEAIVEISESSKGEVKLPVKSGVGEETIDRASELIIGAESESAKSSEAPEFEGNSRNTITGMVTGDDIYNLTKSGSEPTPSTVRSRFWKNVGVSPGAIILGQTMLKITRWEATSTKESKNIKIETMKVHLLSYEDGHGRTPIPNWPNSSVDPFGDRN